jgi:hypothetical protein
MNPRRRKYEIQVYRSGEGWTNDIAGAEYGNEYTSLREARTALAHFRREWPESKKSQWRITEISSIEGAR